MELLQSTRRRPSKEGKITATLLGEEMLGPAEQPWSRSLHVFSLHHRQRISIRPWHRPPVPRLLDRGLLPEEKLQDPQGPRRQRGGEDREEEGEDSCDAWHGASDARRGRLQPRGATGCRLHDDHGPRRRSGPDLLEAIHAVDMFLVARAESVIDEPLFVLHRGYVDASFSFQFF